MKFPTLLILCIFKLIRASDDFYSLEAIDIDGNPFPFSSLRGKVALIVNVASQCGFTNTYADLQRLKDILGDEGSLFEVIGFPCNQFGQQEPGSNAEIKRFAVDRYKVDFPLMSKVEVIGENAHPVWRFLSRESGLEPGWNFYKYLMDHEGNLVKAEPAQTNVEKMFNTIEKAISKAKAAKDHIKQEL